LPQLGNNNIRRDFMKGYDNWKLDNGERILRSGEIVGNCEICDEAIAEWESHYYVNITGCHVHEDCFDIDYAKSVLDITVRGG
jgi:hypothetical protein